MANDINRVLLVGRLTRDPELRQTGSGTSYCRISIANNRNYTMNGERKEETSFFNCTAWGRQAEIINQYCRKGKQVAIDGRLQQRSWQDQGGQNRSTVDVVIERLQLLGSSGDGGGGGFEPSGGYDRPDYGSSPQNTSYGSGGSSYGPQGGGGYDPGPSSGGGGYGGDPDPMDPGMVEDDDIPF